MTRRDPENPALARFRKSTPTKASLMLYFRSEKCEKIEAEMMLEKMLSNFGGAHNVLGHSDIPQITGILETFWTNKYDPDLLVLNLLQAPRMSRY